MKKLITLILFITALNVNAQIKVKPIVGDTIYIPGKIINGGYFIDKLTLDDNKTTGTGLIVTGGGASAPIATFTRDVGTTGPEMTVHGNSGHITSSYSWNSYVYSLGTTTGNKFRISDHTNLAGTGLRLELDSAGDFDFQAGNITTTGDAIAGSFNGTYKAKVSLSSAQILALNTTPIQAIAAPGAGKIIIIESMTSKLIYNTTDYAGPAALQLVCNGDTGILAYTSILTLSSTAIYNSKPGLNVVQLENKAVDLYAPTSDPTLGDSTIDVYITYQIITL